MIFTQHCRICWSPSQPTFKNPDWEARKYSDYLISSFTTELKNPRKGKAQLSHSHDLVLLPYDIRPHPFFPKVQYLNPQSFAVGAM